jgi:hypothetical protein
MKICFKCNTLFESYFDIGFEKGCPIKDCFGDVVEIDDNIFHPVRTLNEKGYITAFCCSGNLWKSNPYIVFDDIVNKDCFCDYPNNFVQDESGSRVVIRRPINSIEVLERQKELNEATYSLLEWAEKLPIAKDFDVIFIDVKPDDEEQFIKMMQNKFSLFYCDKRSAGNDEVYTFETILSSSKVDSFSKKLKAEAKRNGWRIYMEVDDYESPKKDIK